MPYIKKERRKALEEGVPPVTTGELNYMFTTLALRYMNISKYDYARMNDVIGALEAAKLEFYRRCVAPYEEIKIKENGDVYTGPYLNLVNKETSIEKEQE